MRRLPAAVGVVAVLTVLTAAPAAGGTGPDALHLTRDGGEPVTADAPCTGGVVVVPGARSTCALVVRNAGPTSATLRAWVTQVSLTTPDGRAGAFEDDLRLSWSGASGTGGASLRALAGRERTLVASGHLPAGESTRIETVLELPAAASSGSRSHAGARAASYVVHVRLDGDVPGRPAPGRPSPEGASAQPAGAPSDGTRSVGDLLAATGVPVLRAGLAAVVVTGLGSLLLGAARRRAPDEQPVTPRDGGPDRPGPANGCGDEPCAG